MARKQNTPPKQVPPPAPEKTLEHAGAGQTHEPARFHIAALTDGFRRCGRAWPAAGVEVAAEDLAEGDIERLLAERELVVTPIAKGAE